MKKETLYLRIAGVASIIYVISILSGSFLKITIPFSKLVIPHIILNLILMFFILWGLLIIANKNKMNFLKKFIWVLLVFIIINSLNGLVYSIYYLFTASVYNLFWKALTSLDLVYTVMHILLGFSIFKLRKQFRLLIPITSIFLIITGMLYILPEALLSQIFDSISYYLKINIILLGWVFVVIPSVAYIPLSILFFKVAKLNKEIK